MSDTQPLKANVSQTLGEDVGQALDDLFVLKSIEEIKQLKARYFYLLDHKDWDGWRSEVFTADAVLWVPENEQYYPDRAAPVGGIDNIVEMMSAVMQGIITVHHGHTPIIEITSATTARGVWALEDILFMNIDGYEMRMRGYGHYHETYELVEGIGWRIASSHLTRLVNMLPLDAPEQLWQGTAASHMKEWADRWGLPIKQPQATM
jgi:hypothetical protein